MSSYTLLSLLRQPRQLFRSLSLLNYNLPPIASTVFQGKSSPKSCLNFVSNRLVVSFHNRLLPILNQNETGMSNYNAYVQKRFKKKSSKKSYGKESSKDEEDEEEDDDDEEEDEEGDGLDSKVVTTTTISMRLDALGKSCFNISRAKFEEHFYNGLIRVNGERVGKKSHEIMEGDEIDLIRGFNADNHQHLDVNRVNLLSVDDKASFKGRLKISYRKINKLTIVNYERDPYDGALISN